MSNIKNDQKSKPDESGQPSNVEANGVMALFGAVMNKLHKIGVTCYAENDEATGELVLRVAGAKVEADPAKPKLLRFVMRDGGAGGDHE